MEENRLRGECGKPFETDDEYATICPDCWKKLVGENEGE